MHEFIAQNLQIGGNAGTISNIQGPLVVNGKSNPTLGDIVSQILVFLIPLAAVILFLVFIWGAYDFLLANGNPERVKSARAKITAGIIGFVILLISFLLVRLIATILGFKVIF
jgi:hypothetical protein